MSDFKVFLSHSSKDNREVQRISEELRGAGIETWQGKEDIPFGSSISKETQKNLDESKVLLAFVSEHSLASKWVENEWQVKFFDIAKDQSLSVIPVLLDDCDVPPIFRDLKPLDVRQDGEFSDSIAKLLNHLAVLKAAGTDDGGDIFDGNSSLLHNVMEILEDLENESLSFPFQSEIRIIQALKKVPRSGKHVRLHGFKEGIKARSIYDHVLSLAHLADCMLPNLEPKLSSGEIRDLALCIAFHELNEVILGDIPAYTPLDGYTRKLIKVYAEQRVKTVERDTREEIANNFIWMFLDERNRLALSATMKIYASPKDGIFPIFRALDQMDPIVGIWRYLHHFKGKLGDTPQAFNRKVKDFFENPDIAHYMKNNSIDSRLVETVMVLQDRSKAWDYYTGDAGFFPDFPMTAVPQNAIKWAVEGIDLYTK